ncbi:MAG TPA: type I methionyl aminopeptidase [Candidatus Saccharimonadales bacterium]|nr:type I methionyl aminopeptidase [Candidatus Saccharimonadales bacterium]
MRAKTPADLENMRAGGKLLAAILADLAGRVKPGLTPRELAAYAAAQIKEKDMQPVVLGYDGFPDVICISVNNAIVHGIPTNQPIRQGDLVKLDLTLGYRGMINDSAVTVLAGGHGSAGVQRLLDGTKAALDAGIAAIKGEGTRVGDISQAVQDVLEKEYKLGVIRELVGHGVGYEIHESPNIPNYGVAGTGPVLHAGMTIAIEPMACLGDWHIAFAKDKSTIIMKDGSLGAHFEHTVLITEDGCEIFTLA